MFEEKVPFSTATAEVEKWLDYKRIDPTRRESLEEPIKALTSAIVYGNMKIDDDNKITYKLQFPVLASDETVVYDELTFKPRLSVLDTENKIKNIKATDTDGRVIAVMSALTDKAIGLLKKMDTVDSRVAEAVSVFFL